MNIDHKGAKRPKLSPRYTGASSLLPIERRSPTLSGCELSRIVAEHVD